MMLILSFYTFFGMIVGRWAFMRRCGFFLFLSREFCFFMDLIAVGIWGLFLRGFFLVDFGVVMIVYFRISSH